ncbi:MAG: HAMP domain-containing histidine kinase [Clostridia bacterium]|nr:HAMP domain-containing histidine kinase [Clostridia bacterium]
MNIKMTIRKRLIFSYLSLLVIPIVIVIALIFLISSPLIKMPAIERIENMDNIQTEIGDLIQNAVDENGNLTMIDSEIKALIDTRYIKRVIFVNNEDIITYDTSDSETVGYDISKFDELGITISDIEQYIYYGNNPIGRLIFFPSITIEEALRFLLYIPVAMGILFLGLIIAMIVLLSKIISDGISKPLNELNAAAERISNGDLDFEMTYKQDDELGKLCIEFDRMRLKLKESLDKQAKYENSRKLLLASISHDLRTPLTSIKGYIEALQDGIVSDAEAQERYMNIIVAKTNKLNTLIDDLFVYSKMELGEFKIEQIPVPSDFLLEGLLIPKIDEYADAPFEFILDRAFPMVMLNVDQKRISQVIDNVIHNASKFTQTYIKVSVNIQKQYLQLFVEDDGCGIPKEELPFIFDQFYKVEKSRNSSEQGTGLGLAITKRLVLAHGGKISVKSVEDQGTTFKIELPIAKKPN